MGQNLLAGKIVYKGDEQIDMDHREDEGEQKKLIERYIQEAGSLNAD